jgi:hypothetical protein
MSAFAAACLILTLWVMAAIVSVATGDWPMLAITAFMCLAIVVALYARHRRRPPGA